MAAASMGAAVAVLIAACSPHQGGPLIGSRVEPGDVSLCAPAGVDRQIYFSEPLTNAGDDPIEILDVAWSGTGVSDTTFSIDLEGPGLGQLLGAFAWPAGQDAIGPEQAVLERSVELVGAVIEPRSVAALLIAIEPAHTNTDAYVDRVEVKYQVAGSTFQETTSIEYRIHPGDAC